MQQTQYFSRKRKITGFIALSGLCLLWLFFGSNPFQSKQQVTAKRTLQTSQWQQLRSQLDALKDANFSEHEKFLNLANDIVAKIDLWTQSQQVTDASRPGQPIVRQSLERMAENIKDYLIQLGATEQPQWQMRQQKVWNALSRLLDSYSKNYLQEK